MGYIRKMSLFGWSRLDSIFVISCIFGLSAVSFRGSWKFSNINLQNSDYKSFLNFIIRVSHGILLKTTLILIFFLAKHSYQSPFGWNLVHVLLAASIFFMLVPLIIATDWLRYHLKFLLLTNLITTSCFSRCSINTLQYFILREVHSSTPWPSTGQCGPYYW